MAFAELTPQASRRSPRTCTVTMIVGPDIYPQRQHTRERVADVVKLDDCIACPRSKGLGVGKEKSGLSPHSSRITKATHVGGETHPEELGSPMVARPFHRSLRAEDLEILVVADVVELAARIEECGVGGCSYSRQEEPAAPLMATRTRGIRDHLTSRSAPTRDHVSDGQIPRKDNDEEGRGEKEQEPRSVRQACVVVLNPKPAGVVCYPRGGSKRDQGDPSQRHEESGPQVHAEENHARHKKKARPGHLGLASGMIRAVLATAGQGRKLRLKPVARNGWRLSPRSARPAGSRGTVTFDRPVA